MELLEAIYNRRTIRAFRPEPIPGETLEKILEAGIWAPSHNNNQPWEFTILGSQTRQEMTSLYSNYMEAGPLKNPALSEERKVLIRKFAENLGGAAEVIAVVCLPTETDLDQYDYPLSAAAAIQNISLAAWEKGIGSVWLSFGVSPQARSLLGISEKATIAGILAMGYPVMIPPAQPRIPVSDKIKRLP